MKKLLTLLFAVALTFSMAAVAQEAGRMAQSDTAKTTKAEKKAAKKEKKAAKKAAKKAKKDTAKTSQ